MEHGKEEQYVCEYSKSQDAFHITTPSEEVRMNLGALMAGRPSDYATVGRANSHEEASKICALLRKFISERGKKHE